MQRRKVIALLTGAVSWPLVVRAQERRIYRLGFLTLASRMSSAVAAFLDELRQVALLKETI